MHYQKFYLNSKVKQYIKMEPILIIYFQFILFQGNILLQLLICFDSNRTKEFWMDIDVKQILSDAHFVEKQGMR